VKHAVIFLAFCGSLAGCLETCREPKPAEQANIVSTISSVSAVAEYRLRLAGCRAEGRAAKDAGRADSYVVYDACADAVDADFCRRYQLRCAP
jgi:hypothetical protein